MRARGIGFFAGLCWALAALPAAGGPLGLLDQPQTFPWSVGLTPVSQEEAGGLDPGRGRVRSSVLWFNTYRQAGLGDQMVQQIDMEGLLGTVSVAWSPAPGWEWRSQVQGWALGGGVMDGFFTPFHDLLRVPNQGRETVGPDSYRDYLKGVFDLKTAASGLTQVSTGVRGFAGPWSWTSWVKVPVAGQPDWGWCDTWGGGLGVGWGDHWPLSPWNLELRAGVSTALVIVGSSAAFPDQTGNATVQGGVYLVVEDWNGPRVLVQGNWTAVPRGGAAYESQGAGLLTIGGQLPLGRQWTAEAGITEEFFTWATMEVGFQAGLVWRP